jgi:hypothetical protein
VDHVRAANRITERPPPKRPGRRPGWDVDFGGQLDLAALAPWDIHHQLPADGLLSFFLLRQGDETVPTRVIHTPSTERLSADRPPAKEKVLRLNVTSADACRPRSHHGHVSDASEAVGGAGSA